MNIDFELYRIFYVVANNKNITKASMELNISQPAISKSIKSLEEQLGGQLFVRTKRGVMLTEEGETFYTYIKQAIELINNAENKFTDLINLETGCIKIGISTTLAKEFLLPYIETFHNLYPKINIQIVTNVTYELMSKLKNGIVDLVIFNSTNKKYGNDIETIKCKQLNDCFVVNSTYKELLNKVCTLKELVKYPLILPFKGSNTREFIDNIAKDKGIVLTPSIELTSHSLIAEFTKIGFGVGYVAKEYIKNLIEDKKLFEIKMQEKIPSRNIEIALSNNHLPSFSTKKLIEIIVSSNK